MSASLLNLLIAVAPLGLLVVLLVRGCYPGESAIDRCRKVIRLLREKAPRRARGEESRFTPVILARGGRILGTSLAGRAPPSGRGSVSRFSTWSGGASPPERKSMNTIGKTVIGALTLVALTKVGRADEDPA